MLANDNVVYKWIYSFIKNVVSKENAYIVNSSALTTKPLRDDRIEFKLDKFVANGFVKQKLIKKNNGIYHGSLSQYECDLVIRVFDIPEIATQTAHEIVGALNTNELMHEYMPNIYLKNETLKTRYYEANVGNVIYHIKEISLRAVVLNEYDNSVEKDYFTQVDCPSVTIKYTN